jgi:hypothetical protein
VLQYYRMTLWALLITGEVGSGTERNHLGGNHLGWRHLRWRHSGRLIPGQRTVVTTSNTRYDAIVLYSKRCAFLVRCRLLPERATGTRTAVGENLCRRYCTEYTHSDLLHTDSCSYRQPSLHPDTAETSTKNLPTVLPTCHPVPRRSHRYTTLFTTIRIQNRTWRFRCKDGHDHGHHALSRSELALLIASYSSFRSSRISFSISMSSTVSS